jgi:hypothetical protein
MKDERWRSAGPGFEPGRAGPRLSLASSQDNLLSTSFFGLLVEKRGLQNMFWWILFVEVNDHGLLGVPYSRFEARLAGDSRIMIRIPDR